MIEGLVLLFVACLAGGGSYRLAEWAKAPDWLRFTVGIAVTLLCVLVFPQWLVE